jgi:tripartite-type tricarboxylate transporter receptor subunit TctC
VIARNLANQMKVSLSQPVIIENVTGAGGTIGTGRVARAAPDGYTLGIGQNETHVITGATYALQYDVLNAFEPVALLSTTPLLLLARKAMPADDLKGLIAWLKANPNKATQGHLGFGGSGQRRRQASTNPPRGPATAVALIRMRPVLKQPQQHIDRSIFEPLLKLEWVKFIDRQLDCCC